MIGSRIEDAAGFAARLPTLLRGIFLEGWIPSALEPADPKAYLEHVRRGLPTELADEPERYARALQHMIANYVGAREATRIDRLLPMPA